MTITQKQQVIAHLEKYGSITSWEAIKKYNITRLAAIIFDLRDEGNKIYASNEKKNGKRWAKYVLMKLKAK
jgi:predicted methyltransferase